MRKETKCLAFIINGSGIQLGIDKVELIRAMPEPRTVKEVRGLIGGSNQSFQD